MFVLYMENVNIVNSNKNAIILLNPHNLQGKSIHRQLWRGLHTDSVILYLLGAEFPVTEGEPGHCQQHGATRDESPVQ